MIPFEEIDRAMKHFYSKCELGTNIPRVDPFVAKSNKEKLKKYLDDKANKIFIHELIRKYK